VEKLECIVCGRKFPLGQGIIVNICGFTLRFHSKNCAVKFFRVFASRLTGDEAKRVTKEVIDEFLSKLNEQRKLKSKKL